MDHTLWMSELLNSNTLTGLEVIFSIPQLSSPSLNVFWIMEIIVLLSLFVRPFDVGLCGVVWVFANPTTSKIALNFLLSKENFNTYISVHEY